MFPSSTLNNHCFQITVGGNSSSALVPYNNLSYLLRDLTPFTNYTIQVGLLELVIIK